MCVCVCLQQRLTSTSPAASHFRDHRLKLRSHSFRPQGQGIVGCIELRVHLRHTLVLRDRLAFGCLELRQSLADFIVVWQSLALGLQ